PFGVETRFMKSFAEERPLAIRDATPWMRPSTAQLLRFESNLFLALCWPNSRVSTALSCLQTLATSLRSARFLSLRKGGESLARKGVVRKRQSVHRTTASPSKSAQMAISQCTFQEESS